MRKIHMTTLDRLFSRFIRARTNWTCERCFTRYPPPTLALHCSHFHGRGKKSVRWDPDNAAALCYGCHAFFTAHPQEHCTWFKQRLGEAAFDELRDRAQQIAPITRAHLANLHDWLKDRVTA